MTQGFQQQHAAAGFCIPRSAPTPQHGQKPEPAKATPVKPVRAFQPRPGH